MAVSFFLLSFLLTAVEDVRLGGVGNNMNYNAPWVIVFTQFFFSVIGMLASVAIVSQAITRDHELNTDEILYSSGIGPRAFLLGRFFGAALFGCLVGATAILGTLVGGLMPWLDPERIGPFQIAPFLYALAVITGPNLLFTSAMFFTLAALTRSMLAAFIGAVGFLVAYIVASNFADPEQLEVYALLDPFGATAYLEVSRYWTVHERNTELVPLVGTLLYNRLIWLGIGIGALCFAAWRYGFSVEGSAWRRRQTPQAASKEQPLRQAVSVRQVFGPRTSVAQIGSQVRMDLRAVFKSVPFYALLGFAALNLWGGFEGATRIFGTEVLPTTGGLLRAIGSSYLFFILLIIIYYSGEVVHRERLTRVADVVDAMPFPSYVMIASKVLALWAVVAALMVFAWAMGLLRQVTSDYTEFEMGLYGLSLFFVQGGFFFLTCVLAVFVQVLAANKWLGMIAFLVVFFGFQTLPSLGFEHGLYLFGTPSAPHSDMNGYGHFMVPLIAFTGYWSLISVLLGLLSHLFFVQGRPDGFGERVASARTRFSAGVATVAGLSLIAAAGLGGWIYYNTNVLNEYRTSDSVEALRAEYEKRYKLRELDPIPEATAFDTKIDLFPDERRLESRGTMRMFNKTDAPIQEIMVGAHPVATVNSMLVDGQEAVRQDETYSVWWFDFGEGGLAPGETSELTWHITWSHEGFANDNEADVTDGASNRVVANGTFVNNFEIMPVPGYNSGLELTDPTVRREYDLPPVERLPKLGDPRWLMRSQLGLSERVDFRTEFSTSANQIAIAPGYLVGEPVLRDGRAIYTYEMDEPIWPFFSFVSARYEVVRDTWRDVAIEIYHDPKHAYNVEPMIRSTQKSLAYFTKEFSPYQYRQFRILEFPRYATFAQSFPNTIPYSEAIGFVADLRDEHAIDSVFYVTAHELAHQWWGHQVAGAQMQGMTVIVETLAQYSALMVMEREYGPDKMRRFLRYELDRYLQSRGSELIEELPLIYSENQQYIHYQKGSLVMYALQDAIGEDRVNLALRNFLAKWAYGSGPFPTAKDLVSEFRAVALAEHQDLISDLFEAITLYDLAVGGVEVREETGPEGEPLWRTVIDASAKKFYADGEGAETEASVGVWVDVGAFPDSEDELEDYQLPAPLSMQKYFLDGETTTIEIVTRQPPHRVGVDPYNKLIDRNPEDNLKFVD